MFFDDLLLNVERALKNEDWGEHFAESIGKEYSAALIDEFQDTDNIQFRIFTKIFNGKGKVLFLIGDPKQAIYGFRGADIFSYLNAAEQVDKSYTLTKNWRSQEELIKAVNTIFSRVKNPFLLENIRFTEVESGGNPSLKEYHDLKKEYHPLTIWISPSDQSGNPVNKINAREIIAASVAVEISRILNSGYSGQLLIGDSPVKPRDIAILVRRNDDAVIIQSNLAKYNIASVLNDRGDIFKSKEALEIERVLKAVENPGNIKSLKTALATNIIGLNGNEIYNLSFQTEFLEIWISKFRNLNEIWSKSGFMKMFKTLLREEDVLSRVVTFEGGERSVTNINHLGELLFIESLTNNPGKDSLINWLAKKRLSERFSEEEQQLRLESDEDAVNIITMHKSKGLEFPVVFAPFLWDVRSNNSKKSFAKFHDQENELKLTLDLGSEKFEENKKRQDYEDLAENIRLMYVTVTRAKNLCYFVWGRISGAEFSAPAYLLHKNLLYGEENEKVFPISKIKELKDSDLLSELNELQKESEGTIFVKNMPLEAGEVCRISGEVQEDLKLKEINKIIKDDFKISSYSYMTSNYEGFSRQQEEEIEPGKINMKKNREIEETFLDKECSIYSFPGGTNAGLFFHSLLEQLDFSNDDSVYLKKQIETSLTEFGYNQIWIDTIYETIKKVQNITLGNSNSKFLLKELKTENLRREIEFYFPLTKIESGKLKEFFSINGLNSPDGDGAIEIEKLTFNSFTGFMRGFIDLIVESKDKFFIIDWKSNFLGGGPEFYNDTNLTNNVAENHYYLQYFLYTAALHLYLKKRLKNYSYDKNFGGVYYIYLRGLVKDQDRGNGIFGDRPSEKVIEQFCNEFVRRGRI